MPRVILSSYREYAYVTLKRGNFFCSTGSGLYLIDVSNLQNPELKVIYQMSGPNRLGFKDNLLFVCDGSDGLKVFDKSEPSNLVQINQFKDIAGMMLFLWKNLYY